MMSALDALCPTHAKVLAGEIPEVKNSPAMLTAIGRIDDRLANSELRDIVRDQSVDKNLAWSVSMIGTLGNAVESIHQSCLVRLAAVTVAWLETYGFTMEDIVMAIADERLRQRQLFAARKLSFRFDSPAVSPFRKLRVLTEEIGEVAEAIDDLEAHPKSPIRRQHLITELVQVAAVTVAWLESLEAK